jgi:hypothetical protein
MTSNGNNIIAAIGREHRFGRWSVDKSIKNGITIVN